MPGIVISTLYKFRGRNRRELDEKGRRRLEEGGVGDDEEKKEK